MRTELPVVAAVASLVIVVVGHLLMRTQAGRAQGALCQTPVVARGGVRLKHHSCCCISRWAHCSAAAGLVHRHVAVHQQLTHSTGRAGAACVGVNSGHG
jgi:hypothetical protein